MKRNTFCLFAIFVCIAFSLSATNVEAYIKRTKITSSATDEALATIYIYGVNFGDNPQVKLKNEPLTVDTSSDGYIEAQLPADIDPGTYRLAVARDGQFFRPFKRDTMDVTIGAVGPEGQEGPPGAQGPKGDPGVANYSVIDCTFNEWEFGPFASTEFWCDCPAGTRVLGGGAYAHFYQSIDLVASYPFTDTQWKVRMTHRYDSTVVADVHVKVICATIQYVE